VNLEFKSIYEERQRVVNEFLTQSLGYLDAPKAKSVQVLVESMEYSFLEGGKRFRPVLCILLAEAFGVKPQRILPWAMAIELIHTYSLVHDDLPCMDNDDFRRGVPTNHKVYSESTALLAGDALLSEAFRQIALQYESESEKVVRLIRILSEAAGVQGMVAGQAIDLNSKKDSLSVPELDLMHSLKTGALIRAACEGVAVILGLPVEAQTKCRLFGAQLGVSFQLKDDLLDSQENIEKGSYPEALGMERTQQYLDEVQEQASRYLCELSIISGPLHELLKMNNERQI
jgi:geranylgeranyl diphosphate synthase type II